MSVTKYDIEKSDSLRAYFNRLDITVSEINKQFEKFGTNEKAYLLTGDINQYKKDMTELGTVLKRIGQDLSNDGFCIIQPATNVTPITAIKDDNKRAGTAKQNSTPKKRSKRMV